MEDRLQQGLMEALVPLLAQQVLITMCSRLPVLLMVLVLARIFIILTLWELRRLSLVLAWRALALLPSIILWRGPLVRAELTRLVTQLVPFPSLLPLP